MRRIKIEDGPHYDERKKALSAWAKYIYDFSSDNYADVIIHEFFNGSKLRTSLDKLVAVNDNDRDPVILFQSELIGKDR